MIRMLRFALTGLLFAFAVACGDSECPKGEYCPSDPQIRVDQTERALVWGPLFTASLGTIHTWNVVPGTIPAYKAWDEDPCDTSGSADHSWSTTVNNKQQDYVDLSSIQNNRLLKKFNLVFCGKRGSGSPGDGQTARLLPYIVLDGTTYNAPTEFAVDPTSPASLGQRVIDLTALTYFKTASTTLQLGAQYKGCNEGSCGGVDVYSAYVVITGL